MKVFLLRPRLEAQRLVDEDGVCETVIIGGRRLWLCWAERYNDMDCGYYYVRANNPEASRRPQVCVTYCIIAVLGTVLFFQATVLSLMVISCLIVSLGVAGVWTFSE